MKNLILFFLVFSICPPPLFVLNSQTQQDAPSVIKYKLDQEIAQAWDEVSSQLVNDIKSEYAYDENGSLTQSIVSLWQGDQWANESKTEFIYDTNGYLIHNIDFAWNQEQLQWYFNTRTDYERDANGNPIQKIYFFWDLTEFHWNAFWKTEYLYNESGNLTQKIVYNNINPSVWSEYEKTEYSCNTNGKPIQEIRYSWIGQWCENVKIDYTYDTNEKLVQFIVNWWDEGTSQWITTDKTEYTYNLNDNLTEHIEYWWDYNENQWHNALKVEYSFSDLYSYYDLILPYFYKNFEYDIGYIHQMLIPSTATLFNLGEVFFNHMMTNRLEYGWDSDLNDWIVRNNFEFSYSEQEMLSISDIDTKELKIFPNPATSILTIKSNNNPIEKVKIYSLSGKKVNEVDSDFNNINVEELSNGIYLLRIYSEKEIMVKKLIKK